jgi:hypothetical protein
VEKITYQISTGLIFKTWADQLTIDAHIQGPAPEVAAPEPGDCERMVLEYV